LQYQPVLKKLSAILLEADVDHVILEGYVFCIINYLLLFHLTKHRNIQNRVHQMRSFKKASELRVLLLDSTSLASGTNIIEATHIVFLGLYFIIYLICFLLFLSYFLFCK